MGQEWAQALVAHVPRLCHLRVLSCTPLNNPPELQRLQPPTALKDAGIRLRIERPSAKRNLPLHKHCRQIKNGKREIKTFKVQTLFGAF